MDLWGVKEPNYQPAVCGSGGFPSHVGLSLWAVVSHASGTPRYEVAPTVINFTRSLMVSFAQPLGELTESGLSNTKGRD